MARQSSAGVQWREWSDEAFADAQREDKLILLDISASWCHWCHVMDRTTYSEPIVARLISERFIPIKVDGDKRPDVQDRYLLGGWPTTAVLTPDGRILNGSTFLPVDALVTMLCETSMTYQEHKATATMRVMEKEERWEEDGGLPEMPRSPLDPKALHSLTMALKRDFDPWHGGFGTEPKFPYPDALRFAFLQYRKIGDPNMLEMATRTLDGMMGIYDRVWGGFYRYSVNGQWTEPHYEKMLYLQAGLLDNYLEGYQVTGNERYGETAAGIKAYVERRLSDHERGGFYGSQDADVGSHDPEAKFVPGEEYYPRSEEERLKVGIPAVDRTIFTDWNGVMVSAYCRLYHVMGDEHARDFALKTVDRLLDESSSDGRMCHYVDGRPRVPGLLSDQVYFAQGLIDTYQTSGARKYLGEAMRLVDYMTRELEDKEDGGFYFQQASPQSPGELARSHKPFDENVAAAKLLMEMHYLTGYHDYRDLARRTLESVAHPQIAENIMGAGFGLALDLYINHPVHIIVVGDRNSHQTQEMLETGLHTYQPQKIVQVLDPDEDTLTIGDITYGAEEIPLAYVCVRNVCTTPVRGAEGLVAILEDVIGGAPS